MVRSGDQERASLPGERGLPRSHPRSRRPAPPASRARWRPTQASTGGPAAAQPRQSAAGAALGQPARGTLPDWDTWAARRAEMPSGAPQSSAADLRELAELGDLLGELAGLVRDLGALIMGLITAAAGVGGRPRRAFAVPPELAELAGAHQELKAEQRALSARFESGAGDGGDRTALRASLAALTERATRAVAVAVAVSFPQGRAASPEHLRDTNRERRIACKCRHRSPSRSTRRTSTSQRTGRRWSRRTCPLSRSALSCTCGTAPRWSPRYAGAAACRSSSTSSCMTYPTPWRAPPARWPSCGPRSSPCTRRAART